MYQVIDEHNTMKFKCNECDIEWAYNHLPEINVKDIKCPKCGRNDEIVVYAAPPWYPYYPYYTYYPYTLTIDGTLNKWTTTVGTSGDIYHAYNAEGERL